MSPRKSAEEKVIEQMPTAYLKCRRLTHSWDDYTADDSGPTVIQTIICVRCGYSKDQELTHSGRRTGKAPTPHYPPGYLVHDENVNLRDADGKAAIWRELQRRGAQIGNVTHISNGNRKGA